MITNEAVEAAARRLWILNGGLPESERPSWADTRAAARWILEAAAKASESEAQ